MIQSSTTSSGGKTKCHGAIVLVTLLIALVFSCKKDTVESPSEPPPPNPQPSLDYRDTFVGTYTGVYVSYSNIWNPPPQNTNTYSEFSATNHTIQILKVNALGMDSFLCSSQLLQAMSWPTPVFMNDTFLIRSNGQYMINNFPSIQPDRLNFFGDSLKTDHFRLTGAMNNITEGMKFRGKR